MKSARRTLGAVKARAQGTLDTDTLRPNESMDAVWQDIRDGLAALAENGGIEVLTMPENGLTQRLLSELLPRCQQRNRPYFFQKEYMEDDRDGHSRRVDMVAQASHGGYVMIDGVRCGGGQPFLALEAKRLPPPDLRREREYVCQRPGKTPPDADDRGAKTSETGGVARFKLGVHARGLKAVGMIGYIQRHSFEDWRATINRWVDELIADPATPGFWNESDKLELETTWPRVAQLRSNNLRVSDNRRLSMRHVWVQLAQTTTGAESGTEEAHAKKA